jgi:hypothetical protein
MAAHGWAVIGRRRFIGTLPVLVLGVNEWLSAQGATAVVAYHDATAADHQKQFDAPDGLLKKGLRIRSLSVYRNANTTLYAAVWTNAPGPAWQAFHGRSSAGYQQLFNELTKQGYRPTIITATGGGALGGGQTNESVFAGVFEHGATGYVAKHDVDGQAFKDTCDWAKKNQHVLRCAAIYGGLNRSYAGIWEHAPGVTWDHKISVAIDSAEQGLPTTMTGNSALRLSFISRSPYAEYLAVYRNDQTGQLAERHGLTSSQYQTQFNDLTAKGFSPICVQAGGDPRVSGTPRFAALFHKPSIAIKKLPSSETLKPVRRP